MRKLLVLCSCAWLLACATTLTGRRQLKLVPDDQMAAMGVAAFDDLKQQGNVADDPALQKYVRCVTKPLLQVIPESGAAPEGGAWEIVVFEDPTPNAFALPGGKIGVHTGMLDVATNDAQLAAVIGHEIAHVLLRHGNERVSQGLVAQGVLEVGSVAIGDMPPEMQQVVVGGLGVGAQYGVLLPFSRKHESEADVLGQKWMAEAGYDPSEAVALWERMRDLSQGGQPPEFMSTHPAHETRIEDLQQNLSETLDLYRAARAAGRNPECRRP